MSEKNYKSLEINITVNTRKCPIIILYYKTITIFNMASLFYKKNELYNATKVLRCKVYKFANNIVSFIMNPIHAHKSLISFTSFHGIRVLSLDKELFEYNLCNSALYYREVMTSYIQYYKNNSISFILR